MSHICEHYKRRKDCKECQDNTEAQVPVRGFRQSLFAFGAIIHTRKIVQTFAQLSCTLKAYANSDCVSTHSDSVHIQKNTAMSMGQQKVSRFQTTCFSRMQPQNCRGATNVSSLHVFDSSEAFIYCHCLQQGSSLPEEMEFSYNDIQTTVEHKLPRLWKGKLCD